MHAQHFVECYHSAIALPAYLWQYKGIGIKIHPPNDRELEMIQARINEQIFIMADAMEDWRDIVPEEVKEIERRQRMRSEGLEDTEP